MTKEEHLQKQINLLYNSILNLKDGLRCTGTQQQQSMLNEYGIMFEKAFDNLDKNYEETKE